MIEDTSNNISFFVKKTHELDNEEINQINDLHNKIFREYIKIPRTKEAFIIRFTNNEKKYSFHGIMKKNDQIIGSYPVIPNKFKYFDKEIFFGLAVDTTIDQEYQGNLDNLVKLNYLVYEKLKKEKIHFVYGVANKKYYKIIKKLFSYRDICTLNYFVKPLKLKKIYPFDLLFNLIIKLYNLTSQIFSLTQNTSSIKKNIFQNKFINEQSNLKNFNSTKIVENDNFKFAYKINIEKRFGRNIKCLYIFEIYPLTNKNIFESVSYCSNNFNEIELIIYLTNINIKCSNLFCIPTFFLENKVIVSGKILDNSIIDDNIFKNKNWNLNLSNFDIK